MSNEFLIELAWGASEKSTCLRRQVGAVLLTKTGKRIQASNGSPNDVLNCVLRGTCLRDAMGVASGTRHELCNAIHAEQRVIVKALKTGDSPVGGILYVTHKPCVLCAKLCIEVGISEIYYSEDYPDDLSTELLKLANVKLQRI